MEELIVRFPHLSEAIYDFIDNQSLSNCVKVDRYWQNYLRNQKFFEIRIIKATVKQFHNMGETWNKIFKSASTEIIFAFGNAVQFFYQKNSNLDYHEDINPIHVAAATGKLSLLIAIQEKLGKRTLEMARVGHLYTIQHKMANSVKIAKGKRECFL